MIKTTCPIHKGQIEVDENWAKTNKLVFCPVCCKSFEFKEDMDNKSVEEKFDDEVKEILKEYVEEDEELWII